MTAIQQSHRALLKIRFTFPGGVKGRLTRDEQVVIWRYGAWLNALAAGALAPTTPKQQQFVSVAQGLAEPQSIYELAWVHFIKADADVKAELERLKTEKKAQMERAMKSDTSPWSGSYGTGLGVGASRYSSGPVKSQASASPTERWAPCHQCGGDGGAGGRCPSCGGNGFEN